jgi:WD40 repeat protein
MKLLKKLRGLHGDEAITSLCVLEASEIATGDDSGCIKIWNKETFQCQRTWRFNGDFIADMRYLPGKKMLFAVSGDGSLAVYNVKKDELLAQSDNFDDEYHTLEFVQGEKKLICFSPSGFADVYLWDFWGKLADRIITESDADEEGGFSVDSVCKYDEDTLIAGCSDGKIRTLAFPKAVYSSEAVVENSSEMSVEGLGISADRSLVASFSHENCVCLWSVDEILALKNERLQEPSIGRKQSSRKKAKKQQENNDFFADLL